jgi:kumamolisin
VGDALATALTDPAGQPSMITSSVVFCERELGAEAIRLTEFVLAAAVAGGTVVVAAAGDRGSSACAPGDTSAAVSYPASSPNVLAIGGVNGSGAVWSRPADEVAGGGGGSAVFGGRRLPDLSALASAPDLPPIPACTPDCGWRRYSGTSFAAPFVGGALIAVNQARESRGRDGVAFGVGGAARTVDPAAVVDVVTGSNDLYDVGCCDAGPGFDEASGYGVPRFDVLAGG